MRSTPEASGIASIPQSGLTAMRWKLRSTTSPQPAAQRSMGFWLKTG